MWRESSEPVAAPVAQDICCDRAGSYSVALGVPDPPEGFTQGFTGFGTNQSLPPKDLPVQEERLTGRGRYRDRPSHFCVFNGEGQQGCHQGPVGMDPERGAQHMDRREKTPWEANPTCAKALRPTACSVWPGDGRLTLAWQRRLFLFGTPRD